MTASPAYQRFLASTVMDYEKWHDGVGYDLAALDEMGQSERDGAEKLMLNRSLEWREIEVLEKLGSARGWNAIREVFDDNRSIATRLSAAEALERGGKLDIAMDRVVAETVREIRDIGEGSTRALLLAEQHPSEQVKRALLEAAGRKSEIAMHCAALLCYLSGKAKEAFDWELRPLFLRLVPGNELSDRELAYRELCALVEMTP